ncbi:hypothetical protein SASPL_140763 [Salvia splendens]|uniref:Uncharacterized protein n=1 Tax=Salvia splendens TaxID=180675 RepID=A0A8X8ZC64_SALSN|nr:hypothetical protein SASPL_140763 [Salvia splendens]
MSRASKWFRGLLSFKKPDPTAAPSQNPPSKKKWSFPKGKHRRRSHHHALVPGGYVDIDETSRQVIALATATAAVAAVAQLTSGGGFDRAWCPKRRRLFVPGGVCGCCDSIPFSCLSRNLLALSLSCYIAGNRSGNKSRRLEEITRIIED